MALIIARTLELLPLTTLTTAVTGIVPAAPFDRITFNEGAYLVVQANFVYGTGGTTAKFWVQTTIDGVIWRDIASFAFTTASATKTSAVNIYTALAAVAGASDGALADDTITNGYLGDAIRVKYTTTGTYATSTTIRLTASIRD